MKKIFFLLALFGAATALRAQDVIIGVRGGLSIPNIRPSGTNPLSEGYSSVRTFGGGTFAEFPVTEAFSLHVGLEYSRQGGEKNGMQALPAAPVLEAVAGQFGENGVVLTALLPKDDYLYADFKGTARFDYLMLPVQARWGRNLSPGSRWRVYAGAGVFGAYRLRAERVSTGSSPFHVRQGNDYVSLGDYVATGMASIPGLGAEMIEGVRQMLDGNVRVADNTQEITDEIKAFNFGLTATVGLSYRLCERHRVFIEGGGNYGLVKIQKSDVNGQNRIGAASVMVGYGFTL